MGSKTEMTGDTLAVTQLIFSHLGVQVWKNDIMLLVTLNCLKFAEKKEEEEDEVITYQHQFLLLVTKFLWHTSHVIMTHQGVITLLFKILLHISFNFNSSF